MTERREMMLEVEAVIANFHVNDEIKARRVVEVTERVQQPQDGRRVFVCQESLQWLSDTTTLSGDNALTGITMMVELSLMDLADYALPRRGKIDRSQFFHPTRWQEPDFPKFAVFTLCWDEEEEQTIGVWGFEPHMRNLGLVTDKPDGPVS